MVGAEEDGEGMVRLRDARGQADACQADGDDPAKLHASLHAVSADSCRALERQGDYCREVNGIQFCATAWRLLERIPTALSASAYLSARCQSLGRLAFSAMPLVPSRVSSLAATSSRLTPTELNSTSQW